MKDDVLRMFFSQREFLNRFLFKAGNIAHLKLSLCNAHNDKQKAAWEGGEIIKYGEWKRISIVFFLKKKKFLIYSTH